jgi:hypothetical protein
MTSHNHKYNDHALKTAIEVSEQLKKISATTTFFEKPINFDHLTGLKTFSQTNSTNYADFNDGHFMGLAYEGLHDTPYYYQLCSKGWKWQ